MRAENCPWDEKTCAGAALGGHLQVLQWARANDCPWDKRTCAGAALGGHLKVLQWARANGCQWDEESVAAAAEGGHLEVMLALIPSVLAPTRRLRTVPHRCTRLRQRATRRWCGR